MDLHLSRIRDLFDTGDDQHEDLTSKGISGYSVKWPAIIESAPVYTRTEPEIRQYSGKAIYAISQDKCHIDRVRVYYIIMHNST
jgi:hypothetical protein